MDEHTTIYMDEHGTYVEPTNDERLFAMLIYLSSFATTIIGPLLIWLLKRDDSRFVDYHGKEYLNFLISYIVYGVIAGILVILLVGIVLLALLGFLAFVLMVVAGIKAYQGEYYRIPFIFRIIK